MTTAPEEEIDLKIDDAPAPEIEVKVEEVAEKPPEDLDAALIEMREQLKAAREATADAERRAAESASTAANAHRDKIDADIALLDSALQTVKSNQVSAKARYAEALAVGDFSLAAEINEEMVQNAEHLRVFTQGRQGLEDAKRSAPVPVSSPSVEQVASSLTPKSAAWIRAHPEFATDRNKFDQMIAAHNLAVARRIEPESPEYFRFVERTLEIDSDGGSPSASRSASYDANTAQQDTARAVGGRQASAPPAAPPSRQAASGGASPTTIRLSKEEVEVAGMMGLTPEQYARNKAALKKEGRMH